MTKRFTYASNAKLVVTIRDEDENPLDISGASTKRLLLKGPNGEELVRTASFETDGTDGKLKYVVQDSDYGTDKLSLGDWLIQAHVFVDGNDYTSTDEFKITARLFDPDA